MRGYYGNFKTMRTTTFKLVFTFLSILFIHQLNAQDNMKYNKLTPEEERVIINKGTEMPFTGEYYNNKETGTYTCRQCGAELYKSEDKFDSQCGWPSFDDEIDGAVKRLTDADGRRTEIICTNCAGHLGHVFLGEGFTDKDIRHCVNSISMEFVPADQKATNKTETAIFASGCFWGTEYYLQKEKGVKSTTVGYTGGKVKNPSYNEVCTGRTGHAEAVEVEFDPSVISYETLARLYFETHDFTQVNRQGPDIGEQYRSVIFYTNEQQKVVTEKLVKELTNKGYNVATSIEKAGEFYDAENYHQDYYSKSGGTPYCHIKREIF